MALTCSNCGSNNIKIEEVTGRGKPPRKYTWKPGQPRISWKGIWNVYTCNDCNKTWKILKG